MHLKSTHNVVQSKEGFDGVHKIIDTSLLKGFHKLRIRIWIDRRPTEFGHVIRAVEIQSPMFESLSRCGTFSRVSKVFSRVSHNLCEFVSVFSNASDNLLGIKWPRSVSYDLEADSTDLIHDHVVWIYLSKMLWWWHGCSFQRSCS